MSNSSIYEGGSCKGSQTYFSGYARPEKNRVGLEGETGPELILNEKQTKEELETNKEKMAEFYKGYKCPGYFEEVNK